MAISLCLKENRHNLFESVRRTTSLTCTVSYVKALRLQQFALMGMEPPSQLEILRSSRRSRSIHALSIWWWFFVMEHVSLRMRGWEGRSIPSSKATKNLANSMGCLLEWCTILIYQLRDELVHCHAEGNTCTRMCASEQATTRSV